MAIAATPNQNTTYVQQGNGQVLISWNYVAGATSYSIQRSTNGGLSYTVLTTTTNNFYVDTSVTAGSQYFYGVASVNGSGTSAYTIGQGTVPVIGGTASLGSIRLAALQRADRVGSNFVSLPEANFFVNQSAFELYDLLTTVYEDYNVAQPAQFNTNGTTSLFPLPNGILQFTNTAGALYTAPPLYKLLGVDLGLNPTPNGWVTIKKFNFIDRNKYIYPNTASTIYGVFQLQYRMIGNNIEFIPIPSANQPIRLWYVPRMTQLLLDTDTLDGISGWTQYVIIRTAKYILDKEESDTSKLDEEIAFLKGRIEETAINRDAGQTDTVSDTRGSGWNQNGFTNFPGGGR